MLTASAGLARDKGLRSAMKKNLAAGTPIVASVHAAVEQFVAVFTSMGGLMAERATDLRDIERRVVAHLVGEPEPGVSLPATPCVLVAEDLAPADTAGLDPTVVHALVTEKGGPTSHTAIIARQLAIPCVVGTAGALGIANGTRLLVDGTAGTIETEPDADEADRRVAADREQRAALAAWAGPGRTKDGAPVKLLANVADGESAREGRARSRSRASACSAPSCASSTARRSPSVEEQADIYARCSSPSARVSTSSSAPSTRGPTSPSPSPPSRARRTPPSACAACGCRGATPPCWTTSSTASPRRPSAPAPRPG